VAIWRRGGAHPSEAPFRWQSRGRVGDLWASQLVPPANGGQPFETAGQVPVRLAEEFHGRRQQHSADNGRVDQHGGGETDASCFSHNRDSVAKIAKTNTITVAAAVDSAGTHLAPAESAETSGPGSGEDFASGIQVCSSHKDLLRTGGREVLEH
jgi:hypothetical protein